MMENKQTEKNNQEFANTTATPSINPEVINPYETKSTNGPKIAAIAALVGFGSFGLGSLFEQSLDLGGVVLLIYLVLPISALVFLFGSCKALLFLGILSRCQKLVFVITILGSIFALLGIVVYTRHTNRPIEYSQQQKYCSQKSGPYLTDEQYVAYKACLSE